METLKSLGKYQIKRRIGRGGMGVVYEAHDPNIDRAVAIKTISRDQLDADEAAQHATEFRREARAAGQLNHPNIVTVFDFGEEAGYAYIVMELIRGGELKHVLESNQQLPLHQIVGIIEQLLSALEYSHKRKVIHRDIKPANIMLDEHGDVKLADFGIARIESTQATMTQVKGTPAYMSPEQVEGEQIDHRSDLYSTGVVLYELLTGSRPFSGSFVSLVNKILLEPHQPPSERNPDLPPQFDAVLDRALAKRREDRYASAREFSIALRRAMEQSGFPSDGTEVFERPPAPVGTATPGGGSERNTLTGARPGGEGATGTGAGTGSRSSSGVSDAAEIEFWRSVKDSGDADDLDDYLKQYPDGQFRGLAERKLARLRGDAAATGSGPSSATSAAALAEARREKARLAREAAEQALREAQAAEEAERLAEQEARQRAEQERIEAERRAEEEARQRAEQQRLEAERQRAEQQRAEAERKRAEEEARQHAEQQRLEAQRLRAEQERIEAERKRAEEEARQHAEQQRLEAQRQRAEQERAEAQRRTEEAARRQAEEEKLAAERRPAQAEHDEAQRRADDAAWLEAQSRQLDTVQFDAHARPASAATVTARVPQAGEHATATADEDKKGQSTGKSSRSLAVPLGVGAVAVAGVIAWMVGGGDDPVSPPAPAEETPAAPPIAAQAPVAAPSIPAPTITPQAPTAPAVPDASAVRKAEQDAADLQAAEQKRKAEEVRVAEEQRLANEKRATDEKRLIEEKGLADEKRAAEEKRKTEEKRLAEEKRKIEEAERQRIAAEEKRKIEEAERQRIAEEKRRTEEADRQRLAEEKRKTEEAERQRLAEEKRKAEEAAKPAVQVAALAPSELAKQGRASLASGNRREGLKLLKQAALAGHVESSTFLSEYFRGLHGGNSDPLETVKWTRLANEQGASIQGKQKF